MMKHVFLQVCVLVLCFSPSLGQAKNVFLDEDFASLSRWKPFSFPKIERQTSYSIVDDNGLSCLQSVSDASASAMLLEETFSVSRYPILSWRWKISNVYKKGDARKKEGDDYPIRLYVMFEYEPETASWGQKTKYGFAKLLYGAYPPHSSLNYIWANRDLAENILPNAYTSQAMMFPVDAGSAKVGQWVEHRVDIVKDYRAAFGEDPPAIASIAVMSDADDTGESATACIDYITIYAGEDEQK